ncbi:hypothetical protein E5K00_11130 [Hymenobacter aquaticus]|uniref:Uncharacterized protein n=1 Tax=Hymenobacter aquaticus TaxID=1867101 RepID=A0A4Z0Q960_9BACT|nr:hypothetical protein [Hymenobacter aquaticus]TGE25713.1 hypothetical protein E5K00_11130 [Hymenobacter aquaticus]
MTLRLSALLLALALSSPLLAQQAPRQLNTLPALPDSARRPGRQPQVPPPAVEVVAPPSQPAAPAQQPVNEPTRYLVGLKNGTVYKAYDVELKQPLFGRSHILLDDRQRVEMSEVSFYEDETGHYVRALLPKASKETTLRRDKVGRLSLYSITSSQYAGSGYSPYGYGGRYGGYGGPVYRTVKTEYFSKDNGPIQNMSLRNLSVATADNAGSTALLMQARRYQTYSTLSYVAAAGTVAAGLFATLNPRNSGVSPLVYASIPLGILPVIWGSRQQKSIRQAIALYNRGLQ